MPAYGTRTTPNALYPGDTGLSIDGEANTDYTTGTAAERFALNQNPDGSARQISMQVEFDADPGAFEIDLQTSDQDITGAFATPDTAFQVTAASQFGSSGNYYARTEVPVKALFVRSLVVTQTANPCNITVRITG